MFTRELIFLYFVFQTYTDMLCNKPVCLFKKKKKRISTKPKHRSLSLIHISNPSPPPCSHTTSYNRNDPSPPLNPVPPSVQLHIFLANSLCFSVCVCVCVCVFVCVHPFKLTLFLSTHVGQSHTLILKHPISTMQYNS